MSISIWINEANGWIFYEILNSAFSRLVITEVVTHAFSSNPEPNKPQRNTYKEGWWAATRVGKKQHLLWPNTSITSSATGWSWGPANHLPRPPLTLSSFLSAPSTPHGSIQAAEKPCFGQSTVITPKGTCIHLLLPSCAAGRWHSTAHNCCSVPGTESQFDQTINLTAPAHLWELQKCGTWHLPHHRDVALSYLPRAKLMCCKKGFFLFLCRQANI